MAGDRDYWNNLLEACLEEIRTHSAIVGAAEGDPYMEEDLIESTARLAQLQVKKLLIEDKLSSLG